METLKKTDEKRFGLKDLITGLVAVAIYCLAAALTVMYVKSGGDYPSGSDTYAHLYKAKTLSDSINEGNFFPLIDMSWYNGVQFLRYWSPLPVYVLALFIKLTGSVNGAYLAFIFFINVAGAMVWLIIGFINKRPILGAVLGLLWFYIPNNLLALFTEGNLPRSLSMIFLPIFIYSIYSFLNKRRIRSFVAVTISFFLIACCHSGYAGMCALAVLVYLFIYSISEKEIKGPGYIIAAMISGFLIMGVWLVPSLIGGITSTDSSEVMKSFFQNIFITLNPLLRLKDGNLYFYAGLPEFIIMLLGLLASGKKERTGFITGFITILLTSAPAYYILKVLPGSQYLWMLRFISIALAFTFMSLIYWKTLKKKILIVFLIVIALDIIPSIRLLRGDGKMTVKAREKYYRETMLADEARSLTVQRMALIDESTDGSRGQYLLTEGSGGIVYQTFGAGWQSASTANNIVSLNRAASTGNYDYLFDRCLAMGDDTVLIKKSILQDKGEQRSYIDSSAALSGYKLYDENDGYLLYHLENVTGRFGIKSTYSSIGIGKNIYETALSSPDMREGDSIYLDDYSYSELKKYKMIFLCGFSYHDKSKAENLVRRLTGDGVYFIIYGDGLPVMRTADSGSFLGVSAENVEFENGYPILRYKGRRIDPQLFSPDFRHWKTVYLNGLHEIWGYANEDGVKLPFIGTGENDHEIFVGFNISYHYSLTRDPAIGDILSSVSGGLLNKVPKRETVPIDVTEKNGGLLLRSPENHVNTTIAYNDIYSARKGKIYERNHLLHVNKGKTVITYRYPYLFRGTLLSILALVFFISCIWKLKRETRK